MSKRSSSPAPRRHRILRGLIALSLSIAAILGGTLTARAFFVSPAEVQHYVECFGFMLTDPEQHRAQCSPYRGPEGGPLVNGYNGASPPATTTTAAPPPTTTTTEVPPTTTTTVVPPTTTVTTTTQECRVEDCECQRNCAA